MPRLLRRVLWFVCGGIVIFFVSVCIVVAAIASRVSEKSDAPRSLALPSDTPLQPAAPNLQLDDFTCGFRAVAAAYEVYGMSPEEKNLRFRLGTDREAVPIFTGEGSRGTLHPDMLRVVTQDGFSHEFIDPAAEDAAARLRANLRPAISSGAGSGRDAGSNSRNRATPADDDRAPKHYVLSSERQERSNAVAIILIRHRGGASLHWVLSDAWAVGTDDDATTHGDRYALRIVDSVRREPYFEPLDLYLKEKVLSIILIRPAETSTPDPDYPTDALADANAKAPVNANHNEEDAVSAAHRAGLAEMLRVRERMKFGG